MAKTPNAPSDWRRVFTKSPGETAETARQFYQDIRDGKLKSLSLGVPRLDEMIHRLYPGHLVGIIARPSHWKTGLLIHVARVAAQQIMADDNLDDLVWFISAEEDEQLVQARVTGTFIDERSVMTVEQDFIDGVLRQRAQWPVWFTGQSPIPQLKDKLHHTPAMTVDRMWEELKYIKKETGKKPRAILVDYLQVLEIEDSTDQRNNAVSKTLKLLKQLAIQEQVCVLFGCQAKERVDDRKLPLPLANDAYYSSEVLHHADVLLSLLYPIRSPQYTAAPVVFPNGAEVNCGPNLLWLQLLKQRNAKGTGWAALEVDPVHSHIKGDYRAAYPEDFGGIPPLEGGGIL